MATEITKTDNCVAVTLDNYTEADSDRDSSEVLEEIDVLSHSKDELAELLPCSCVEGDELPCWFCVLAGWKALLEDESEGENYCLLPTLSPNIRASSPFVMQSQLSKTTSSRSF